MQTTSASKQSLEPSLSECVDLASTLHACNCTVQPSSCPHLLSSRLLLTGCVPPPSSSTRLLAWCLQTTAHAILLSATAHMLQQSISWCPSCPAASFPASFPVSCPPAALSSLCILQQQPAHHCSHVRSNQACQILCVVLLGGQEGGLLLCPLCQHGLQGAPQAQEHGGRVHDHLQHVGIALQTMVGMGTKHAC